MACNYCGENRFKTEGQLHCHISKNHAEFACTCYRRYMTEDELKAHKEEMQKNAKEFKCSECCRSFSTQEGLHQHKRAKGHWKEGERDAAQQKTGMFFCHDKCGRSFATKEGLDDHTTYHRSAKDKNKCYNCLKSFKDPSRLAQHIKDTGHKNNGSCDKRNQYVTRFYEIKVSIDPAEKKEAVAEVREITHRLIDHVRQQPDGEIYSADIRKAGSHAAKTKIEKANEFDLNIQLNIKDIEEVTRGKLGYEYEKTKESGKGAPSPNNMNVDRQLKDIPEELRKEIPIGTAFVVVNNNGDKGLDHLTYNGDLVPGEVKQDFYRKLKTAISELGLESKVHLSRDAHGPAITLTIKRPGSYDINVDMVPTISSSTPVEVNGWPRPDTRRAYSEDQIQAVQEAGLHLVPKNDTTWDISYSKAETAMFAALDRGNGCRKAVLKCMKKVIQSPYGLPGVSSYLVKHSLLWTSERHHEPGHWDRKEFAECLIESMHEFEQALRAGKLPNYFNTSDNILKNMDRVTLDRLADRVHKEKMRLIHM